MIDQTLHVWPYPDEVYTIGIDYLIEPPDLANPTDTPILPVPYHDVLVFGALKQIAMRERDLWSIGNYGNEYAQRLQQFIERAVHDGRQPVEREIDAVVGDAALREIVGTDALGAIAAADLQLARLRLG